MEVKLALDTNRYTDLARGVPEVVNNVGQAEAVYLPFITVAETRAGFLLGQRRMENEGVFLKFLTRSNVYILHPDDQTTHVYADLFRQLRRQGTPIPSNDLWTAALVVQHGLTLYARDKHFDALPQLPRL